ncbi:hypothetical protein A2U01_0026964 [Trifolium medium]|uniref:Uncharacterized protein n=1 Tax=Trifolium medium TaxID=97028 RepID=A0A392P3B7_9FABA|nr:hypothetical protein [Trifolium medium]
MLEEPKTDLEEPTPSMKSDPAVKKPRTEKVGNQRGGAPTVTPKCSRPLKGLKVETEGEDKHTSSLQQLLESTS